MSRKAVLACLIFSAVVYYAVLVPLGLRSLEDAVKLTIDAAWWSSVGMALHWWVNRRRAAGR